MEYWEQSGHWKDYYQILQIDPSAEPEVIRAAHDKLSLKYHPDHNKDPMANQRMKDINEAYEILGDSEKGKHYHSDYVQRVNKSGDGILNKTTPPAKPKSSEQSDKTSPSVKSKPEVYPEKAQYQDSEDKIKNYQILRVTDEHLNEFICGTTPAVQEKDLERMARCEIYKYDAAGNIFGLAYPTGKQDGFHNKVELLDSKIAIFDVNEEIRKITGDIALNEGNKAKIIWALNVELMQVDEDLKRLNENLKEQINELRLIIAKIKDNKPLSEEEKKIAIFLLNKQWELAYLKYCGIINSFPQKTQRASFAR